MQNILVGKDTKEQIRIVELELVKLLDNTYVIERRTGVLHCKLVKQKDVFIRVGKQNRTIKQQAQFQYNSYIQHYKDRGYKLVDFDIHSTSIEDINGLLPEFKTDDNGNKKPMLAKSIKDIKIPNAFTKPHYTSRKLDGVRCMILKKDGVIKSVSRGGKSYDLAIKHILNNSIIKRLFITYPDLILDGELYIHGYSLQRISGLCRTENNPNKTKIIQFHIYDIGDRELLFEERLKILNSIKGKYAIPSNNFEICIIDHEIIYNLEEAYNKNKQYVSEGYEGCVVRSSDCKYNFGARSNQMFKIKNYQEDEFEIVGIDKKERNEDMTFICKLKDGRTFQAKPIGNRELKTEYINNIDTIIGKLGTVKFFNYSEDGIPTQPVFKCVRDYE